MIRKAFLRLGVALLAARGLAAAQKSSVIPLVTLNPTKTWRLVRSQAFQVEAIQQWGGEPSVEREYGVKSLERQTYQSEDKVVDMFVEEASDVSSAYGLFTFYQTQATAPEPDLQLALSSPTLTYMARGPYFIRIPRLPTAGPQLSNSEFHAFLIFVAGARPSPEARASVPAALPAQGLVPGSEKYLLGPEAARRALPSFRIDLLGFSQGAEVQTADYLTGNEHAKVIAVSYPTPQIARIRFGAMEHFLGINQDHGEGSLYGKRQGSFVFLVEARAAAAATRLMDQFKVSRSVSWDEKYPGSESVWVQLAKLVLANLALVGVLVCLAILGGGLIFISRRLAARWFPDWIWGHPEEDRFIRLKLS